jgi:Zn-dependent alcohol dehydrogenase
MPNKNLVKPLWIEEVEVASPQANKVFLKILFTTL